MPFPLLRAQLVAPILAAQLHDSHREGTTTDDLSLWLAERANTPTDAVLIFALVFLTRVMLDRWDRRRRSRDRPPKKQTPKGA